MVPARKELNHVDLDTTLNKTSKPITTPHNISSNKTALIEPTLYLGIRDEIGKINKQTIYYKSDDKNWHVKINQMSRDEKKGI